MNIVPLPFQWERLQPTLNQAFDAAYLAKLHSTAGPWRDLGANVLLDAHYYPYYKVNGAERVSRASKSALPERRSPR